MAPPTTLAELLNQAPSGSPALIVPVSPISPSSAVAPSPAVTLSYQALGEQVERLASQFSGAGLKPGDVVAMVLPNGPEFLAVFLALVRAGLVAQPINPADKAPEMSSLIGAGQAKAVIAAHDDPTAAHAAAQAAAQAAAAHSLPLWQPRLEPPGVVSVAQLASVAPRAAQPPRPNDLAVLMYTSGTTGKPKGVPLTHGNLLSSALAIATHYALSGADRCLAVMPFFHGHGLIGAALSTLASGGTLIVPPRFSASGFWPLWREHHATWYTAVPTIHQVLLMRADSDAAPARGPRFIRSCSAALAPAVLAELESRFGAPVLEAYGMTEAAHQVASNPLPPRPRKPGTVGLATAVEIAVIDGAGNRLPANAAGEVVVCGPSVMSGYRDNPQANAEAFVQGWFRTGDLGVLDPQGYLSLTGRIKELINRGGEKISPDEVEAALLENPAVAEAAVFGIPDAKYGEAVGAAVVLKAATDAQALKAFCRARLADFKVPTTIHVTSALPKNATGKIERRELAAHFESEAK